MNDNFIKQIKSSFCDEHILVAEIIRFTEEEKKEISPILYNYIVNNISNGNDVFTCAAIRKYVAIFDKKEINNLIKLFSFDFNVWIAIELSKVCFYNIEYLKCDKLNLEIQKLFEKYIKIENSEGDTVLWMTGCYLKHVFPDSDILTRVPKYVAEMIEDENNGIHRKIHR